MKSGSVVRPYWLGSAMAVLFVLGACSEGGVVSPVDQGPLVGAADFIPPSGGPGDPNPTAFGKTAGAPDVERFEICKRWVGAVGVATFEVSGPVLTHQTSTNDGSWYGPFDALGRSGWFCRDVWLEGAAGQIVTAQEISATGANPYTLTLVEALTSTTSTPNPATIGADYVSGRVDGFTGAGVTAFFTNTEEVPPGDQGCTPGYWKQVHHFGNWTGYATGDSYNAVFGVTSSFGGTLLQALNRGGGGEIALGRHAVAALLNAANAGVNAVYSEAQVIAMVQAAYASGNFEGTKNLLAAANELGCPLGRAL